jgi:hypothetical protein
MAAYRTMCMRTRLCLVVLAFLSAACAPSGEATAPEPYRDGVEGPRANAWSASVAFPSLGERDCVTADVQWDLRGRHTGWNVRSRRSEVAAPREAADAERSYGQWQFDSRGRQVSESRCRLDGKISSRALAQRFFSEALRQKTSINGLPAVIGVGTVCYWELDAYGDYTGDVLCGGELCTSVLAALRLTPVGDAQPNEASSEVVWSWSCSGGGTISLLGSGVAQYTPPGEEPPVGVIPPCGPPGGGVGEPGDTLAELRALRALCADSMPNWCIPQSAPGVRDTTCYVPLPPSDSARIDSLLTHMLQPLDSITDTTARAACEALATASRSMLNSSGIVKGKYNTPATDTLAHYGMFEYNTFTIHLEPFLLASAGAPNQFEPLTHSKGLLLLNVLHEAGHALYPPLEHQPNNNPPYTSGPWQYLNHYQSTSPTVRSPCIKW